MNCKSAIEMLSLYLWGELSLEEEDLLGQHLNECGQCRRELERTKAVHRAYDQIQMKPPEYLLEQCRRELPGTIRQGSKNASESIGWRGYLHALLQPTKLLTTAWLKPVGAVALVALGFFAARFTAVTPSSFSDSEPVTTRVRYIDPSPSGEVRIVVDRTHQQVLSGTLEDESIQSLLLMAMRDPTDPGLRADSAELLKSKRDTEEVRRAFLSTMRNDPNPGVRLKALEGMGPYSGDAESRTALSQVLLYDDNPAIRSRAIDLLISSDQHDVVGTLQELLRYENDSYVRSRSQEALRAMHASVETF